MKRPDCLSCGKLGTLRAERIIQAKGAVTNYYCSACEHEWDERDDHTVASVPRKRERPDTPHTRL
jgi:NAD-dependent SIR2 family protein deacetylase